MDKLPFNCHEMGIEVRLGVVLGFLEFMRLRKSRVEQRYKIPNPGGRL